jgi:hypothetical protein
MPACQSRVPRMKALMRLLALVISIAADFVRQFFPDVTIFLPE